MSAIPALTLDQITERGLDPAFRLLPASMDTPEARTMILSIGLQETRFAYRRQIVEVKGVLKPVGAAKSFWSGELGGGMVRGVRVHPATRDLAAEIYAARHVKPTDTAIWNAIEHDDVLAAGLARLLLFADPHRLPRLGDVVGAWNTYERVWRPGQPKRLTWDALYRRALAFVQERDL